MPKTLLDFFGNVPKKPKVAASPQCSSSSPSAPRPKEAAASPAAKPKVLCSPPKSNDKAKAALASPREPKPKQKPKPEEVKGKENGVSSFEEEHESEEEVVGSKRRRSSAAAPTAKKRRRLVVDSESEEEYVPDKDEESEEYEDDYSEEATPSPPPKRKSQSKPRSVPASPALSTPSRGGRVSDATKSKLSFFAATDEDEGSAAGDARAPAGDGPDAGAPEETWEHLSLPFLKPERRRDAEGHRPNHEEFNACTLLVPSDFLAKCTPGMKQWWILKSKNFDTVLFFKVGKFYELYHMDAVTGVNELGLIYMKGSFAHSGFPEIAFGRMSNRLVEKGYKVARVEQTETPEQMAERTRGKPSKEKVVRREICQITTPGARSLHARCGNLATDVGLQRRQFLLALKELPFEGMASNDGERDFTRRFGVAFVDTSEGKIQVGEFFDDRQCSRLRTLFAHFPPAQVLTERNNLSASTQHLLTNCLPASLKERLIPKKEFWEAEKTIVFLGESGHFGDGDFVLPKCLTAMLDDMDTLGRTVHPSYQLAVSALGGLVFYLRRCLLDAEVLSMARMEEYRPIDCEPAEVAEETNESRFYHRQQHMILDGITLTNLDVLVNSSDSSLKGTLLGRLDTCVTPFGKRLLQAWICSPLCHPADIRERQEAVADLMRNMDEVQRARERMKKLPDLEKLLTKMHVLGCHGKDAEHPDSRAILYEEIVYSKWKIKDLLTTLRGFDEAMEIAASLEDTFEAPLTQALVRRGEGRFPDLQPLLRHFQNAFDHEKAQKEGKIVPEEGVDDDFDAAVEEIKETERELDDYLREQIRRMGCKIVYWGSGRNRFQLEIPDSHASKVPRQYNLSSQRKGVKRYKTDTTEQLLSRMSAAEDRKDAALRDVLRRIFAKVDKEFATWWEAMRCLAQLDALMSLAEFSRSGADAGDVCRPEVCEDAEPFLEIRDGRHPCLTATFLGGDYIPNDTLMGVGEWRSPFLLVTGPNMGGKSTLMRQTALLVLLAQLGCYVPASRCRFTPVDRIFTRLGASDRIMAGESTFLVELSETAAMLQHATRHSLILLDELGRGTATYDGTAIASAVVKELMTRVCSRTLFSTHYHALVEAFATQVSLGHMACLVTEEEADKEDEDGDGPEGIIFLYKFTRGACPKSYGFNAARLAHLPEAVVRRGFAKARELERETTLLRFWREMNTKTFSEEESRTWREHFQEMKLEG